MSPGLYREISHSLGNDVPIARILHNTSTKQVNGTTYSLLHQAVHRVARLQAEPPTTQQSFAAPSSGPYASTMLIDIVDGKRYTYSYEYRYVQEIFMLAAFIPLMDRPRGRRRSSPRTPIRGASSGNQAVVMGRFWERLSG